MRKMNSLVVALSCMGFLAGAASAADIVENPAYAMWSKHKVGTSVSYKTESVITMAGMPDPMKSESKSTQKLVEMKPDAAVVETTTETMGQSFTNKITIAAKVEKGK